MRDSTKTAGSEITSLSDFEYRIIVTASKRFYDPDLFDTHLRKYLKDLGAGTVEQRPSVVFITRDTDTVASTFTKAWCEKRGYTYKPFYAQWDNVEHEEAVVRFNQRTGKEYNALAVVWLTAELSDLATHLITFYDGVSTDTHDLMDSMRERGHPCRAILVDVDKDEENNHGRQSQSG